MIKVFRDRGVVKDIIVSCDSCDLMFSYDTIVALGGLKKMGWKSERTKHFCPEHK